jgi:lipoprotein-anchoring transpeptidase ErfK/SrfK
MEATLTFGSAKPVALARLVAVANATVLVLALLAVSTHRSPGGSIRVTLKGAGVGGTRVTFSPRPLPPAPADSTSAAPGASAPASGSTGGYSAGPYVPPPPRTPDPPVAASTMLAQLEGTVPTFTAPGGTQNGTIGTWYTYQLVLPVTMVQGDWLQVRRPERPNGSVTWIRSSDAFVTSTPYYMVIDVGPELLKVFNGGQQILSLPIGVGAPRTPTPTGNFFIAVHEQSSGYSYGPFILDTSAHSEAIRDWDGRGDAVIAIHGPIDHYADARIGTGNARVSNGCIRMHNQDLQQLSMIPVGTPLDIYG